jgi:hypothetical protein
VSGRPGVPPTRRSVTEPPGTSTDRGTVEGANPTANEVRWRYDAAQFGNAVNTVETIEAWLSGWKNGVHDAIVRKDEHVVVPAFMDSIATHIGRPADPIGYDHFSFRRTNAYECGYADGLRDAYESVERGTSPTTETTSGTGPGVEQRHEDDDSAVAPKTAKHPRQRAPRHQVRPQVDPTSSVYERPWPPPEAGHTCRSSATRSRHMSFTVTNQPSLPVAPCRVRKAGGAAKVPQAHCLHHQGSAPAADTTRIIFVGGDERQARTAVNLASAGMPEGMAVRFYHPCWTHNWNKVAADIKAHLHETDAMVITTDVPTHLDKELRHLARSTGIVWLGARARGRGAIAGALQDARYLVEGR